MAERWVFVVKAQDKSGALTSAASVFSNRGVSLEAILGSGISSMTSKDGRLILSFQATERKKEMLLRAMERLSKVLQVHAYPYDAPQIRAIAIAKVSSLAGLDLETQPVQTETISQTADSLTLMLSGSTFAVEAVIEQLRQRQALLDVVMSAIAI
jgi:acetolactate synthase small subunit